MIAGLPPTVWVLRAVAALGPTVALVAGVPEGYSPRWWLIVLVLAGGVGYALSPEHYVGLLVMVVVVVWWMWEVRGEMPVGALVASAALLAAHVSGLVLSYGPPRTAVIGPVRAVWLPRSAVVWLVAPVIWVVARGYRGHETPSLYWFLGIGVAAVGAVLVALAIPTADEDHHG
jgi:hypothetical protein